MYADTKCDRKKIIKNVLPMSKLRRCHCRFKPILLRWMPLHRRCDDDYWGATRAHVRVVSTSCSVICSPSPRVLTECQIIFTLYLSICYTRQIILKTCPKIWVPCLLICYTWLIMFTVCLGIDIACSVFAPCCFAILRCLFSNLKWCSIAYCCEDLSAKLV